ncbi:MAG: AAA family ATPase [Candidatus Omnitrophica bacterium]|nr:AAA family ATPase [Candidatus Omnitrophota bacterium]
MYFKKLELIGFKSFLDKTTLQFEPGISAIVGPNGCGKSNVVDSIRWVLGEQSAKSLRGSEMQDVIFNGTDLKEPLGMAEVSLTFDNQQRFFNFDHNEVCITRRIFRSGESEYLLNKNLIRLRDIQDLLMGTGVGAESYSIVAQGKIDLVLSSRPEERRLVFDEASGITKYKAQKRETLRKMEETEQNLLRINDIITEVRRQIGSLERQANKARKYKEVFEELKSQELNQALLQKRGLLKEKDENISQFRGLEAREEEFLKLITEQEAKIANRQSELKIQEDRIMAIKNQILNLESQIVRTNEHSSFNKEKIIELSANKEYLREQIIQLKARVAADEGKLNALKQEYAGLREAINQKSLELAQKQARLDSLAASIKKSLDAIAAAKKLILALATKIANTRNEASDFGAKSQIYIARKKRLELEKLKVAEEKAAQEESLNCINAEVECLMKTAQEINSRIAGVNLSLGQENLSLAESQVRIAELEKQILTLQSHREFLEKLRTKYQDLGESMNAVIYLDKMPAQKPSGLVVKIKDDQEGETEKLRLSGEAKPIELDTHKIEEQIKKLEEQLGGLKNTMESKKAHIKELEQAVSSSQEELHAQQIALSNKETSRASVLEQFNKIKDEEELILLELQEAQNEISVLEKKITSCQGYLSQLNNEELRVKDGIVREEENISLNSGAREEALMAITQLKTELEALNKRIDSDQGTLKILEETFLQDRESLMNNEKQTKENELKIEALESEISEGEVRLKEFSSVIETENSLLAGSEDKYRLVSEGANDYVKKAESDRKELDNIKKNLHQLQMRDKEIEYKYAAIKDRMLAAYKIDLEACGDTQEEAPAELLSQEIAALKRRLDSCGTVNLVAIEEYDELKKRYDFLIQQQNDLSTAKESLHQAIQKINRTTKQMFLATFEKVKAEFRNYFRLLFNGGDAQLFLIDEQDPLESGIEIICRPPGKKLQNVLLLSGGEKSMSAIALIFAIFKVKPSPFCILDEIDAALDEANIERFSVILQEFARSSQFIVITHNKRTIVNANVMYGITMEQSGVSKIVSVKFAEDKKKDKDLDADMVAV